MPKFSLALILMFLAHISHGQGFKVVANPDKIISDLKKSSANTTSIEAEFREEKTLMALKEPKVSTGTFYYRKQDKMRWEQKFPFRYIILINGDKLRIQDTGKEKNLGGSGRMALQVKELLIGLVNGDFQNNKSFQQTFWENPEYYQVTLTPVNKRLKHVYEKINLLFSRSSLRLRELTFFEKGGDKSLMKFQNEKINQSIPDDTFLTL